MAYQKPLVSDLGFISENTFLRSTGGTPPKDWNVCKTDNHGDYSCS